jgi:hypothetical protein
VERRLDEAQGGLGAAARKTRDLERRLGRIEVETGAGDDEALAREPGAD